MTLKLAIIGGDGTGPEVVQQGLRVLETAAKLDNLDYTTTDFDLGGERYLRTGHVLDDDDIAALRDYHAIYLGAVGHPDVPPGVLEKGLLLKLRFDLDLYINLRPVRLYPGIDTPLKDKNPDDINFTVVRENTEDLYCGQGGISRKNTPHEIATQQMLATRFGVERALRYAFDLARSHDNPHLTLVHKTNVLTYCGDTWFRAFEQIGDNDYPDVTRNYHHVDACCMYMVQSPVAYKTIVVPNMFGDIITDLGAAIAGGMGIAASGNLNPDPDNPAPSMFEPVHGSAPDIAGQNKANPLAAIDSLALLLTETGRIHDNPAAVNAGQRIAQAVQKITPSFTGKRLDRSGYACDEIAQMVIDALE